MLSGHRSTLDRISRKVTDRRAKRLPLTLASRLQPGMTIGLIAPASNGFEDQDIEFAMDIVRSLGFKVKPGRASVRPLWLLGRHGCGAGQ